MDPHPGTAFYIIFLFGVTICLAVLFSKQQRKPRYLNHFPDSTKPFPERLLERLEIMRKENNPENEEVGFVTKRCQFCGSKKIDYGWKIAIPFNHKEKFIKQCNCCNLIVDSL